MAIYHIKETDQIAAPQDDKPSTEYWREVDPALAHDLDFDEIAELNAKYEGVDAELDAPATFDQEQQTRPSWLGFLFSIALIIVITLWLFTSSFGTPVDWGMLARSGELSKDESLQALREAVVSIESIGSGGSGFNIAPDGLIVTNRHVVEDKGSVTVRFGGENRGGYPSNEWVELDSVDLAIVDIEAEEMPFVKLSNELPNIGDEIVFIGSPLGYDWTISDGQIADIWYSDGVPVLVIDGPIKPGSSGSPVFNDKSEVIGVIYARLSDSDNQGLAIPITYLTTYLEEIYEH